MSSINWFWIAIGMINLLFAYDYIRNQEWFWFFLAITGTFLGFYNGLEKLLKYTT